MELILLVTMGCFQPLDLRQCNKFEVRSGSDDKDQVEFQAAIACTAVSDGEAFIILTVDWNKGSSCRLKGLCQSIATLNEKHFKVLPGVKVVRPY